MPEASNMQSISIPKTVTTIGEGAFSVCMSLDKIILPDSVTSIGAYAFAESGISSIKIGNRTKRIGEEAFVNCWYLKSITIPSSVNRIDNGPFIGCDNIKFIKFAGNIPKIQSNLFGMADGVNAKATAYYPVGNKTWTKENRKDYGAEKLTWKKWNPYTTTLSSVKSGKKSATVKWKKHKKATGYQIQYSTSKKIKGAKTNTVKGASKTSVTLKKLKGKKKYYIRVRTYKTDSGKKYYSAWSKSKAVTTKK